MESTNNFGIDTLLADKNSELEGKYLTFWTDQQLFGVPISDVVQIIGMQEITPIPDFPYYAKGIINQRGSIIPVIDVRLRLNKEEAEYNDRTCIIVASILGYYFGFIVDEVNEVTEIPNDVISPPPQVDDSENPYLTGIARLNNKLVLTIDTAKLLGRTEFNALMGAGF